MLQPDRARRQRRRRLAGLAIAASAVGIACATLGAAREASKANDEWQKAVRVESRMSGRTIEIVRYLYEVEARQAFDLAMIRVHAEELERQAAGTEPGSAVRRQAMAERRAADALARQFAETNGMAANNKLIADPKYRTLDGGYNVRQRLLDLQQEEWNSPDDPDRTAEVGDAHAERARRWTMLMTLSQPVSVAGMAVWRRSGRRESRPVLPQRRSASQPRPLPPGTERRSSTARLPQQDPETRPAIGLNPPSPTADSVDKEPSNAVHRVLFGFALGLSVLATLFTVLQIQSDLDKRRALGTAGQHAAEVTATAAGGGVRHAFRDGARSEVALLYGKQRQQAAVAIPIDASAPRLAAADAATVARLERIIGAMAAAPRRDDGLAPPIHSVVSATLADAVAAAEQQHGSVAAAQRAGARSNAMVIALFVVTNAAILLDLAAATRRRSRSRYS